MSVLRVLVSPGILEKWLKEPSGTRKKGWGKSDGNTQIEKPNTPLNMIYLLLEPVVEFRTQLIPCVTCKSKFKLQFFCK